MIRLKLVESRLIGKKKKRKRKIPPWSLGIYLTRTDFTWCEAKVSKLNSKIVAKEEEEEKRYDTMFPRCHFLFTDSGDRPRKRYDFLSTNRAKEQTILFPPPLPSLPPLAQ